MGKVGGVGDPGEVGSRGVRCVQVHSDSCQAGIVVQ